MQFSDTHQINPLKKIKSVLLKFTAFSLPGASVLFKLTAFSLLGSQFCFPWTTEALPVDHPFALAAAA